MDTLEQRTMARVSARLLPFLIVCYFVAYLDRVNVSFAALTMNKDLGLSASALTKRLRNASSNQCSNSRRRGFRRHIAFLDFAHRLPARSCGGRWYRQSSIQLVISRASLGHR
jgi:hypothetical protein